MHDLLRLYDLEKICPDKSIISLLVFSIHVCDVHVILGDRRLGVAAEPRITAPGLRAPHYIPPPNLRLL
jgi:hypothetical protein